jgi:hypothetical protein
MTLQAFNTFQQDQQLPRPQNPKLAASRELTLSQAELDYAFHL